MSENKIKASLALFVNEFGSVTAINVNDDGTCWADTHNRYTRISQNMSVEFPAMDEGDVTAARIKALESQEWKARQDFELSMRELASKRQELEGGK
jgi:hypothetical protein